MTIIRRKPFPLSSVSIGLGVILPPDACLGMWFGAAFFWWQGRRHPTPGTQRKSRSGSKGSSRSAPASSAARRSSVSPTRSPTSCSSASQFKVGRRTLHVERSGPRMDRRDLPIFELENAIVRSLGAQPRLILQAPTGSGKSTQVPQILLDHGLLGDRRGRDSAAAPPRRAIAGRARGQRAPEPARR